jgi:hypothetical protein
MSRLARLARKINLWTELRVDCLPIFFVGKRSADIACAMNARTTHLITGDHQHFGPCFGKIIEGIVIVTP